MPAPIATLGLTPALDRMSLQEARKRQLILCEGQGQSILLRAHTCQELDLHWAYLQGLAATQHRVLDASDFEHWLQAQESQTAALSLQTGSAPHSDQPSANVLNVSLASVESTTNATIRMVSASIRDALRAGASDIHFEATPTGLRVRFRLDGVLLDAADRPDLVLAEQVISRIKVLSDLDISEKRVPQDGRMSVELDDRTIDIRVSIMPSVHGEDAVLRILDRSHLRRQLGDLSLTGLGLPQELATAFSRLCSAPHGMVLVTGPTGSGKTTTLYAALAASRRSDEKIITIEDPVEYQLDGSLQIPVNEKKGLTFARGLRSILRHDPDRILVGEIRDQETAQIAVQAALTGHVVYTTVHANHALDVLARFAQFGISGYELSSALNGILAQRLIRILCPACSRAQQRSPLADPNCPTCRGTGFSGRRAIGELVIVTPELRRAIAAGATWIELQGLANEQGTTSLRQAALNLEAQGLTTRSEVDRVTGA